MEEQEAPPSKSQRKRDMLALQALGERLVDMRADQLARLPLAEELRTAVASAQNTQSHGARRRQLQLIGKLMRYADASAIAQGLDQLTSGTAAETQRQHALERWRSSILADETAVLEELLADWPRLDVQQLRQLARAARQEQRTGKPVGAGRKLFRFLRASTEAS
jgi:ribosome-associated protein